MMTVKTTEFPVVVQGARILAIAVPLLALLVAGVIATPGNARPFDKVKESKELLVVVYRDNKPFSWEEDGKVRGIDADLARAIAIELGVKPNILIRSAGEEVDDDIRSNVWQGPRTGGPKGDVMMHVPMEPALVKRNDRATLSNAYYNEDVVLAVNTDLVGPDEGLLAFTKLKVACEFSTSAHYFLAFTEDQKIKNNVSPFSKFEDAVLNFTSKESAGLVGRRAQIEAFLKDSDISVRYVPLKFPPSLRSNWNIGTAVDNDSRDLGKAVGNAIAALRASGEFEKIFTSYGVTPVPAR